MSQRWMSRHGYARQRLASLKRGLALLEDALFSPSHRATRSKSRGEEEDVSSLSSVAAAVALAGGFLSDRTVPPHALAPPSRHHRSAGDSEGNGGRDSTDIQATLVRELLREPLGELSESSTPAAKAARYQALMKPVVIKERLVANAVACRLGLPSRFLWPMAPSELLPGAEATDGGDGRAPALPPAESRAYLWDSAVRTTSGHRVLSSKATSTTSLIALTADALFAHDSPPTASRQLSRPRPHSPPPCGEGGGVLHSSSAESYLCLLHTAKTQALHRCATSSAGVGGVSPVALGPSSAEALHRDLQRLVLYCSDQVDPLLLQAATLVGIPHIRVLQTVLAHHPLAKTRGDTGTMYRVDVGELKKKVIEDVTKGLFPCLVVGVFGSALSASVDPLGELAAFCHKSGIWFHVDASHGAAALLSAGGGGRSRAAECKQGGDGLGAAREGLAEDFARAVAVADSVHCSNAACDGLPFPLLPSGARPRSAQEALPLVSFTDASAVSLLYLSNVNKLRWSRRRLLCTAQEGSNHVVRGALAPSPAATGGGSWPSDSAAPSLDSDVRLVDGQSGRGAVLDESVLSLAHSDYEACCEEVRRRVCGHQCLMHEVQSRLQGDGRFDCALSASCLFGRVYLRLLTYADETTAELARGIVGEEAASDADSEALHVSLVVLQRRLWVCLTVSSVNEADGGRSAACDIADRARRAADRVLSKP